MPHSMLAAEHWKWRGAKRVHTKAGDFFNVRVIRKYTVGLATLSHVVQICLLLHTIILQVQYNHNNQWHLSKTTQMDPQPHQFPSKFSKLW